MGRGSSKAGGGGGKVIAFPGNSSKNDLWDYRGEVDRTNSLIANADKATSPNQMQRAGAALRDHDRHLTNMIDNERSGNVDIKGDVDVLTTQRRKTRQAIRRLRERY